MTRRMSPVHALERWHDFYVLVGTAGATLVGLLFVALSIGAGFLSSQRAAPTRAFFSPVVVHFAAVLIVSALALAPEHASIVVSVAIGICAVVGEVVSIFTTIQLLRYRWTNYVQDHVSYGLLPALCYAGLLVAAWMILAGNERALDLLAGALLLLLVVNIRNAWDLMLSMVHHQTERAERERTKDN